MEAWLFHLHNGVPYFHPVWLALGVFVGSWLPSVVRMVQAVSRPLSAFLRRF